MKKIQLLGKNLSRLDQKIITGGFVDPGDGGGASGCTYNCPGHSPVSYSSCSGICYTLNEYPYGVGCTGETAPNDKKWCSTS